MLTTGRSTSGNSRNDRRVTAPTPRMNSKSDITVAKTGRRTDRSEIIIWPFSTERGSLGDTRRARAGFMRLVREVRGHCIDRALGTLHARALAHLLRAFDDHPFSGTQAGKYFDTSGPAYADADFTARDLAFADHEHVLAFGFRRERLFGNDQRFALVVREAHI